MRLACGKRGDPSTVIATSAANFYALVALLRFIGRLIRAGDVDLILVGQMIDRAVGRDPGEGKGA